MTQLLLVRHGETDWNRELRVQGHADPSLNETGRRQARALAERLAGVRVDAIYSSDLARARETAEILAASFDAPVRFDAALREVDTGNWTGLTRDEILESFPDAHRHDGETREQLAERVVAAIDHMRAAHPGGHVLVVTHGGPVRAAWRHAGGYELERIANCGVYRIAFRDGSYLPIH